jgi:hypothetical protein
MTQVKTPTASTEVRSFRIEVPEEDLLHLRQRILATRWPVAKALASNVLGAGDRRRPVSQPMNNARTTG